MSSHCRLTGQRRRRMCWRATRVRSPASPGVPPTSGRWVQPLKRTPETTAHRHHILVAPLLDVLPAQGLQHATPHTTSRPHTPVGEGLLHACTRWRRAATMPRCGSGRCTDRGRPVNALPSRCECLPNQYTGCGIIGGRHRGRVNCSGFCVSSLPCFLSGAHGSSARLHFSCIVFSPPKFPQRTTC